MTQSSRETMLRSLVFPAKKNKSLGKVVGKWLPVLWVGNKFPLVAEGQVSSWVWWLPFFWFACLNQCFSNSRGGEDRNKNMRCNKSYTAHADLLRCFGRQWWQLLAFLRFAPSPATSPGARCLGQSNSLWSWSPCCQVRRIPKFLLLGVVLGVAMLLSLNELRYRKLRITRRFLIFVGV